MECIQDALDVAKADLEEWPQNGWSLLGMSQALNGMGREGAAVQAALDASIAFQNASDAISQPCPSFACSL